VYSTANHGAAGTELTKLMRLGMGRRSSLEHQLSDERELSAYGTCHIGRLVKNDANRLDSR
jgi:hypothetical protein